MLMHLVSFSKIPAIGYLLAFIFLLSTSKCAAIEKRVSVSSPSGRLAVSIASNDAAGLSYSITRDDTPLVEESRLGLQLGDVPAEVKISGVEPSKYEKTWYPVWGKRKEVQNAFNAVDIQLESISPRSETYSISIRAYDDGVAIRYELPSQETQNASHTIFKDLTTVRFAQDATCWSYNGERPNVGPELLSKIEGDRRSPLLAQCGDNCFVAIHEASLYGAPWMSLVVDGNNLTLRVSTAKYSAPSSFKTPWRVLMVGDSPGELLDSDLLLNLNPPNQITDSSWIKPGVSFWDWRAWGHEVDGFTYDLSLPSWKRFVDLAAETGVPYLLLDADWYGPEFESESNPTATGKVNAVRELLDYANARNVGILLYLNDVAGRKYDLEAVLKNYHDWGAKGIKYGFMQGKGKNKVQRTRRIIELCAKYQLFVDFHDGPIPPSGDMRTWPNCLTREFCHAQSDAKRAFTPGTFTTQTFVNGLAGPLDMNNGMFDLKNSVQQRPRMFEEVYSTVVAEAARTLIVFSGLTVVPDSADSYRQHRDLFEFIAAQKMPWVESKTLQGEIGEYIVTLRHTGDTYLIGSATNEQARELSIPLDFLPEGQFEVTLYEDAPDAHFKTNREAYAIRKLKCNASTVIRAKLAPGGGHCMKIVPTSG